MHFSISTLSAVAGAALVESAILALDFSSLFHSSNHSVGSILFAPVSLASLSPVASLAVNPSAHTALDNSSDVADAAAPSTRSQSFDPASLSPHAKASCDLNWALNHIALST